MLNFNFKSKNYFCTRTEKDLWFSVKVEKNALAVNSNLISSCSWNIIPLSLLKSLDLLQVVDTGHYRTGLSINDVIPEGRMIKRW